MARAARGTAGASAASGAGRGGGAGGGAAAGRRRPPPEAVPPAPADALDVKAEALAALHVFGLRRQFEVIARHGTPPATLVRARESVWCVLEAQLARLRGERLTQKDLLALSHGLISPASLSRALADAVEAGVLTLRPDPADARLRRVEPTESVMATLRARAEAGFAEGAAVVDRARARLAALEGGGEATPAATAPPGAATAGRGARRG